MNKGQAVSDEPSKSPQKSVDYVLVASMSGYVHFSEPVPHVASKWLDGVLKYPFFCSSSTFEKYDDDFSFLQVSRIHQLHHSYLFYKRSMSVFVEWCGCFAL